MKNLVGAIAAISLALASPSAALAQLTKAGVVTTLQGTATVARASAPRPMPLKFKDEIFVQDRITTGEDSVARILLGGKAIVTVRERSVLTITEVPGESTIEVGIGKIALAVVKERMKPGESIQIRTPNAIAGIRGTVVITEVEQKTAQLGASPAAFTSRFFVLQGIVSVSQFDPVSRRLGPSITLGSLQTTGVTGATAPRPPQPITPEAAKQLAIDYKTTIKEAPPAANAAVTNAQVQQAVNYVGAVVNPQGAAGQQGSAGQNQQKGDSASGSSSGGSGGASTGSGSGTSAGGSTGSSSSSSGSSGSSGSSTSSATSSGGQGGGKGPSAPALPTAPTPVTAPAPAPTPVTTIVAPPPLTVAPPPVIAAPAVVTPPPVFAPPPVVIVPTIVAPTIISTPTIKLPSSDDLNKDKRGKVERDRGRERGR